MKAAWADILDHCRADYAKLGPLELPAVVPYCDGSSDFDLFQQACSIAISEALGRPVHIFDRGNGNGRGSWYVIADIGPICVFGAGRDCVDVLLAACYEEASQRLGVKCGSEMVDLAEKLFEECGAVETLNCADPFYIEACQEAIRRSGRVQLSDVTTIRREMGCLEYPGDSCKEGTNGQIDGPSQCL
jgi:hypothetical protein